MALFWFAVIVAVVLGFIGLVANGLLYLLVIGAVVLVIDLVLLGVWLGRRASRHSR